MKAKPMLGKRSRGSLADEIAELMSTRPTDAAAREDIVGGADDDQYDGGGGLLAPEDRLQSMPARRMRAEGIDLGSKSSKYAGRIASRKDVLQRQGIDDDKDDDDASSSISADDSEDDDASDGSDVDDAHSDGENGSDAGRNSSDEVGEEHSTEEDGAIPSGESDDGGIQDDGANLYKHWTDMQAEEETLLSQLKETQADELDTARHVKNQHTALLQLLHLRIKLEPALQGAARWPAAEVQGLWDATPSLSSSSSDAAATAASLLRDLYLTQSILCDAMPIDGAAAPVATSTSDLDALGSDPDAWWRLLAATQARSKAWIDASVDAISADLTSEANGGRGTQLSFKAVRQGPLIQCEHLLAQMPCGSDLRDQYCHQSTERVLGVPRKPQVSPGMDHPQDPSTGELYVDSPFYHALLKELLDTGDAASVANATPRLKHSKRATDNRQSKGRKLSFEVQPKLVSFMFPEIPERPAILSEIFASVFGKRTDQPPMHGLPKDTGSRDVQCAAPAPPLFAS